MNIIDLKGNKKFLKEYIRLCCIEWGTECEDSELQTKVDKKILEILTKKNEQLILALGLLVDDNLVGFISLLKTDGDERTDLTPWYGTMYVKEEYRGKGYSKILNREILNESRKLGYKKVYLKTFLKNYYERFGAKYIEKLNNGESLYYIEL